MPKNPFTSLTKVVSRLRIRRPKTIQQIDEEFRKHGFRRGRYQQTVRWLSSTRAAKRFAQGLQELPIGGAPLLMAIEVATVGYTRMARRKKIVGTVKKLFIERPELRKRLIVEVAEALYENWKFKNEEVSDPEFPLFDEKMKVAMYGTFDELYDELNAHNNLRETGSFRGKKFLRDSARELLSDFQFWEQIPRDEKERVMRSFGHVLGEQSGRLPKTDANQLEYIRRTLFHNMALAEKARQMLFDPRINRNPEAKKQARILLMVYLSEIELGNDSRELGAQYFLANQKLVNGILERYGVKRELLKKFQHALASREEFKIITAPEIVEASQLNKTSAKDLQALVEDHAESLREKGTTLRRRLPEILARIRK